MIVRFFKRLFCRHDWKKPELYQGFDLVPEIPGGGFPAMKQRRTCHKCGRIYVKTLYLL